MVAERNPQIAQERSRKQPSPFTDRECRVLSLCLETLDGNWRTLKQTSLEMGVSVSTVKRIQKSAFDKQNRIASSWVFHWR